MAKTEKLDLCKLHKAEYAAGGKPAMVTVEAARYLAADGQGKPGGEDFTATVGALYGMAFTIKMAQKQAGRDYKVCPLEGLYRAEDPRAHFADLPPRQWCWRLLIRVPDFVGAGDLERARSALRAKNKPPQFEQVRLETLDEGPCVQMLHVGPYEREGATLAQMLRLAEAEGLRPRGRHHEVYLSDPRRVPPERLRTILRLPVGPAGKA